MILVEHELTVETIATREMRVLHGRLGRWHCTKMPHKARPGDNVSSGVSLRGPLPCTMLAQKGFGCPLDSRQTKVYF
jgi:hypothetical protein